jgi:hypothetical protein
MGYMLGSSCSACCESCAGDACESGGGNLPATVTATFGAIPNTVEVPLVSLSITSQCDPDESGVIPANGVATGTIGDPNEDGYPESFLGPLTGATVTDGGSGFATLARVQPVLTVSGSAEGGIFTVTLAETVDECGLPAWEIASVKATGELGEYVEDELLTVSIGENDTELAQAELYFAASRSEPTVTAGAATGTGATFNVTLARAGFLPATWQVASVSVSGGTGYVNDQEVTFSVASGDTEDTAAEAKLLTKLDPPEGAFSITTTTGSGATFAPPEFEVILSGNNARRFSVAGSDRPGGVASYLTDDGTGYQVGDTVGIILTNGTEHVAFRAEVDSVGDNGEIIDAFFVEEGVYSLDTGVPESVVVTTAGVYYRAEDSNVHVDFPGLYYGEDADLPRVAYPTTVTITQESPSVGTGAAYSANVDLNPNSETYGQVTSLTLDNGGDDYMAVRMEALPCFKALENQAVVLELVVPCLWEYRPCASNLLVSVQFNGPESPLTLTMHVPGNILVGGIAEPIFPVPPNPIYTLDGSVPDCSDFSVELTHSSDETVTVASGGDPASNSIIEACPFPISASGLGLTATITEEDPFVEEFYPDTGNPKISLSCGSSFDPTSPPATNAIWGVSAGFQTDAIVSGFVYDESVGVAIAFLCPCFYAAAITYSRVNSNGTFSDAAWSGSLSQPLPIGTLPQLSDFEWTQSVSDNPAGQPALPSDPLALVSLTMTEAE